MRTIPFARVTNLRFTAVVLTLGLLVLAVPEVTAATLDDELWIPTAGRGPGGEGSFWITDLYVLNPGEDAVEVVIRFLELSADNSDVEGETFEIEGGSLLVIADVIAELTDAESVFGALHIEVAEEDEGDDERLFLQEDDDDGSDALEEDVPLAVYARIYNRSGEVTQGQALQGFSDHAAITAEGARPSTHVIGISQNAEFRTNWFGLNITEEDDEPAAAEAMVELLATDGEVLGSTSVMLPPDGPVFFSVSDLGGPVDNAVLRFTMESGSAIFGASKVDNASNDGTTLEPFRDSIDPADQSFTSEFFTDGCTFGPTGNNPFFPLQPGLRIVLEGDDDGTPIQVILEVTSETRVVDGVTTRVVTETESEDGELVEVSRNFFAQCMETGDVFYFGEEVDDYEDGVIVGHEGEWLAGENGARAGIIMPGTPLIGSRYFQEVAPGVALDRGEHLAVGVTMETEVGDFENCLVVRDTNALEPSDKGDIKVYCPGIGIVKDEDLEVVEATVP